METPLGILMRIINRIEGSKIKLLEAITKVKETVIGEAFGNRRFVFGLSMFIALIMLALIGPLFAPMKSEAEIFSGTVCTNDRRWLPPSLEHPLGTNHRCEDIYSWIVLGLKNSLWVAALAAFIATAIALTIGLLAGYVGGFLDDILNTLSNFLMVIPMFIVLLMLVVYIPPEMRKAQLVSLIIGVTAWPGAARIIRSMVMQHKAADYVDLAKLTKFSTMEIVFKEIAPNIASYVFLIYINQFSYAIFAETSIGFLGFYPIDAITFGRAFNDMLGGGAIFLWLWWWFLPLGLIITALSFSLLSINLGLQAIFNPRLKLSVYAV